MRRWVARNSCDANVGTAHRMPNYAASQVPNFGPMNARETISWPLWPVHGFLKAYIVRARL
jgi:hypothetical protein